MTVDAAGSQFIASASGNYLVEFPAVGGTSKAKPISPAVNGEGLNGPSDVKVDGAGDLFIADTGNDRIVVVPPGGGAATAMDPTVDGKGLSSPWGVALDGAGGFYIADSGNGRVVQVPAGGGAPRAISPVVNGNGLSSWVADVALDAAGNLFILDTGNSRAVEVPAGGGTPLAIAPTVNGIGFGAPQGIAVDVEGSLFISDAGHNRVVEVPVGGGPAFAISLDGTTLRNPVGMAVDGPGNFYIVDNSNVRVLELQRSLPPTLSFPTATRVDTIDTTDGTQTVEVQNLGNESLTLTDLRYPTDFAEASGDTNACTGSTSVNPGVVCDLPIEFAPTESGPLSEQIVLTDNALNVTGTQQAIAVSGTGYADVEGATHISVASASPASVFAGTPFTIAVTALNLAGTTATTYNGTVSFTSSDPGFVNPGPLTLSSGIGQTTVTLPTVGTATISATDTTTASVTGSGTFDLIPAPRVFLSSTAANQNFGTQAIGSASAAKALTFSIAAGTTVGSIAVVTTGTRNLDFTNAGGGTCTAQDYTAVATCTVEVTFKPLASGVRMGAVVFFSEAGNTGTILGQALIYGTGTGPQIGYSPAPATVFQPRGSVWLSNCRAIAVDAAGNQFIASGGNNNVVEIPANGGAALAISPVVNGESLNSPIGVAVDGTGDLFIVDADNNRVVVVPPGGGAATAIAPTVDGVALSYPQDVLVTAAGDLFIVDANNARVVEVPAGGGAATAISPVVDGKGLYSPIAVAADAAGNLFIADSGNSRVVEVPAGGGPATAFDPTVNGVGLSRSPQGIAVDVAGNLFIADTFNSRVVEVPAAGGPAIAFDPGLSTPVGVTVDGSGNLYIVDNGNTRVVELQRSLTPTVNFPTATGVDAIDTTDGTQTVQVQNLGNEALTLTDLRYPADFPEVSGDTSACTGSTSVNPGLACDLPVEFAPTESGPLSEQITLTDNALNVTGAQQSIPVSGTGEGPAPPSMTTPAPGTTLTGAVAAFSWNPGSGSSAFILAVGTTGVGSSNIYSSGSITGTSVTVANIPTDGKTLYVQLSYEMGTTWNSVSYTYAEYRQPPFGALNPVIDSTTQSTTVGQVDSLEVTGWVADLVDGAPLTNVKVYIDGNAAGTPTLGMQRYDVAVRYNNPAYLDSGFQLLYPASSLSVGTHAATVVAIDSGGRSTTFGPVSFSVSATAGASPPFGSLGPVEDTVTFGNTVGQSDSLDVKGWVADPADGSPLSNVSVYIDGTLAGTPTLGLASPDVAAKYNNAAYAHARFDFLSAASSLPPGPHKLTVVAVDSGGRTTTLGPRTFAVAATAGAGPPFGGLAPVVDSTTQSTTVSPSDSLEVNGWVADVTDGSPLSNVKVYIDEVLAGTPTLGLVSPNVAAEYHNAAYGHARYQFLSPASGLSAGTHWVTVVAIDSGGRSTTFGPRIFTVQ